LKIVEAVDVATAVATAVVFGLVSCRLFVSFRFVAFARCV